MIFRSKKGRDDEPATPAPAAARTTASGPAAAPGKAGRPEARNGGAPAQPGANSEEQQRRAAAAIRHSVAFAQTVTLLMHSPHYKHYTLSDLEWLVLPPLLGGQFSVAEAKLKDSGVPVPVAVALWASVSADVDKRLTQNVGQPMRLRPDEWRSGDILWLFDAVGDARIVPALLKQLGDTVFKGREVKVRGRGEDGKPKLQTLRSLQAKTPGA